MAEGNGEPLDPWFAELVDAIRQWHAEALKTGGVGGEREALLYSSVGRAFQTALGVPLYPSDLEKAGALFHSIVCNHPFLMGTRGPL